MDSNNNFNYLKSGVDLNKAANLKENMKSLLSKHQKENNIGNFGGLFEIKGYKNPVLISSTDGVGSKLLVYSELNKYNLLGQDLVNLSVNDIVCIGAYPLFFLDYIAVEKINEENILSIITGIVKACDENNCKLVGGETAQMAEVYTNGKFDLAGFIVGISEKNKIKDKSDTKSGDLLIGIPSNGIHTNGYSLVRKVFELEENKKTLFQQFDELNSTLGEELSKPHISYFPVIKKIENYMKISAHITGGGFIENIPRVINENLDAVINLGSWEINPIFNLIQKYGKISDQEMFKVFNMGIGLVVVSNEENSKKILSECKNASIIGYLQENQNLKSKVIIN
jgi:phosphoribosylformylglycinamidine cyclo-ligase|tara:strand:- start:3383 stop:4402 length:1020 start_codon:yes stop_codon:yes gene_type:complete